MLLASGITPPEYIGSGTQKSVALITRGYLLLFD